MTSASAAPCTPPPRPSSRSSPIPPWPPASPRPGTDPGGSHRSGPVARRRRHALPVRPRPRPAPPAPAVRHGGDPGRRGRLRAAPGGGAHRSTRPCSSCSTRRPTSHRWPSSTCWRRRRPATGSSSSPCGRTSPSSRPATAPRPGSVVNNHRVKVFLSGIADPGTLEHASTLIGETELRTCGHDRRRLRGACRTPTPRLCADWRRPTPCVGSRPATRVVVSGHLPPVRGPAAALAATTGVCGPGPSGRVPSAEPRDRRDAWPSDRGEPDR